MFILNMATVSSNELSVCAVIPVSLLWTLSLSQLFLLCHLFDVIERWNPQYGPQRASLALPRTPTDCTARLESPAWSAAPGEHDRWVCICSFVWLLCLAAVYGYCTLLAVIYLHICAVLVASFHNVLLWHFAASFLLFAAFLGRVLLILCYLDVFVVVLDS